MSKAMNSEEIFSVSLKVIELVESHTKHTPTAMRILSAAKQGFGDGFSDQAFVERSPAEDSEFRRETSASR